MPKVASGVKADSLLVRATYFDPSQYPEKGALPDYVGRIWRFGPEEDDEEDESFALRGRPSLLDVGTALHGLHRLFESASAMSLGLSAEREVTPDVAEAMEELGIYPKPLAQPYNLVSVEMHSPLALVVQIPAESYVLVGFAVVALAERICTVGTRISKKRSRDLRDKAVYDSQREQFLRGQADAFAYELRRYPRPSTVEVVGADEDPDDLETEPVNMLLPSPQDPQDS